MFAALCSKNSVATETREPDNLKNEAEESVSSHVESTGSSSIKEVTVSVKATPNLISYVRSMGNKLKFKMDSLVPDEAKL